ncbi:diacylglycerol kinase family protein [Nocardia ninae]|uniref:DAGKc domain-containing protein n=1 Tax=Nocardia ninae NBRC 108245 TaxID=1210091 RepID=A0A511MVJ0_9NOCA|nr:diacylglycerol kinase family protein [Nocardia ninae]GEM44278.1 hypothetical protein NN4_87970 [Nocardia ninae NBRC 108245]
MTNPLVTPVGNGIKSIDVIANPCSAWGRGMRRAVATSHYFADRGIRVRQWRGTSPEGTVDLLQQRLSRRDRPDAVVCVGGDDLISTVLQVITHTGIPLGVVPAGPSDDLAIALGIPLDDPRAAADIVLAGKRRDIDLGVIETTSGAQCSVGRTWFATVACTGSDARILDRVSRTRLPSGRTSLAEIATGTARPFRIELSGGNEYSTPLVIDTEALLVTVGNSRSAAGKPICPIALLDDGLLDVTVIGAAMGCLEAMYLFAKLAAGLPIAHPAVTYYRAPAVSLHSPGMHAVVDGARVGELPVTVRAVSAAQAVLVP